MIGHRFGKRNRATVLHAVRKIGRLKLADKWLAGEIRKLAHQIQEADHLT
jgi:chromosomal replication initiation ATPase DnaA